MAKNKDDAEMQRGPEAPLFYHASGAAFAGGSLLS